MRTDGRSRFRLSSWLDAVGIPSLAIVCALVVSLLVAPPAGASSNYTWLYNANGGGGTMTQSQTFSTCTARSLTTSFPPTRSGFSLIGWSLGSRDGEFLGSGTYTNCTNITLFAQWNYTVTFDANGGSASTASARNAAAGVTLPTATRDGFDLAGWYTASSGGTRVGGAADTYNPNIDVTVFAQWSASTYTVTYDAHGGTPTPTPESFAVGGLALTLATSSRSGYTFNGWYTASTGGSLIGTAGDPYPPTATTTLHAQWTPETYTVAFLGNGGTITPSSVNYTVEDPAITLPTAVRSGYTFDGWYTASAGGSLIGTAGDPYTPTASTTLHARWRLIPAPSPVPAPGPGPELRPEPSALSPSPTPPSDTAPKMPLPEPDSLVFNASQELRLLLARNPVLRLNRRLVLSNNGLATLQGVPIRMTLALQQRDLRGRWKVASTRSYRIRETSDGIVTIRRYTKRPLRARITWETSSADAGKTASVTRIFRIV